MRASLRYTQTVHALTMEREELGLEWGCGGGLSILSTTAGVPRGKSGHLIQKHFYKTDFFNIQADEQCSRDPGGHRGNPASSGCAEKQAAYPHRLPVPHQLCHTVDAWLEGRFS